MDRELTAKQVIQELKACQSADELKKYERFFPIRKRGEDQFMGVRMGEVFALAKKNMDMPLHEIEELLENPFHEVRVAGVSIMDFQARRKKTDEVQRRKLYELYINRHDRINSWDLVDRSAPYVVGGYLFDKSRDPLYQLAASTNLWERRTSIVSTLYFIKKGDKVDTLNIAEKLLYDEEELIHKATGWLLRTVGGPELREFLDRHAAMMPRIALRYAVEKLDKTERDHYMKRKR